MIELAVINSEQGALFPMCAACGYRYKDVYRITLCISNTTILLCDRCSNDMATEIGNTNLDPDGPGYDNVVRIVNAVGADAQP